MGPRDATFFLSPETEWQRRYEALRASFVERLPDEVVAERFGFTVNYVRLLRYYFRHGVTGFTEAETGGPKDRKRVPVKIRARILAWRDNNLSSIDIAELLSREGIEISIRTIQRILAKEGAPRLPRRSRMTICDANQKVRSSRFLQNINPVERVL